MNKSREPFPSNNHISVLSDGVRYFEFTQPGGTFFVCIIRADQIVDLLDVRRRSEHPIDGIQRDDDLKRVADISAYASGNDAIFPTPIIVSADSEDFYFENGFIKLKNPEINSSIGHVLDGQHRLFGIRNSTKEAQRRINLMIVFAFDIDRYAEASIFATINGNQKQVPKSLMYDLFSLHPGRSVEKTCHEIVKSLNEDPDSPFFNRIKMLGRKANDSETLSQSAFVDHVRQLIDGERAPLRELYDSKEDWAIRKITSNYFLALNASVEKIRGNDEILRDYFYKTTGFGGAIKALVLLARRGASKGDLSIDWLQPITDKFISEFKIPSGVGNSAMINVRSQIISAAENVNQIKLL